MKDLLSVYKNVKTGKYSALKGEDVSNLEDAEKYTILSGMFHITEVYKRVFYDDEKKLLRREKLLTLNDFNATI